MTREEAIAWVRVHEADSVEDAAEALLRVHREARRAALWVALAEVRDGVRGWEADLVFRIRALIDAAGGVDD